MSDQSVEYILKARDQASDVVSKLSGRFLSLDSAISQLGTSVSVLGIAGGLTAIATGAAAAARSYADFAETLDRQSRTAGTSAQNMQALRRAFEAAGLSGGDAAGAIAKLNKAIDEGNPYLREMGVNGRDAFDAFMQIGATLGTMTDEAHKTKVVSDLMGRSMAENSAIITDLAKSTRDISGVYQQFGGQMDDLAMVKAKQLDQSLDDLDTRLDATTKAFNKHFTPALAGALEGTNNLIDGFSRMLPPLEALEEKLRTGPLSKLLILLTAPGGLLAAPFAILAGSQRNPHEGDSPGYASGYLGGSPYDPAVQPYGGIDMASQVPGVAAAIAARAGASTAGQHLGLRGEQEGQEALAERARKALEKTSSVFLKQVEEVEPRLYGIGVLFAQMSDSVDATTGHMKTMVAANISDAVDRVIYMSATIREALSGMMRGILADIASAAAKLGISLGLQVLGFAIFGEGGGFVGDIGRQVAGGHSMAPAGGNVFNISTLNAKDLIQEIVSPTGQMRQANDRIRDVARAGAL